MTEILKLNDISKVAENALGNNYTLVKESADPKGIMLRSFKMHDYTLDENTIAIARAGAGTNNIPVEKYADQGVVVFNTPGANANAVKELVLTALLVASRNVIPAIDWVKTLKENCGYYNYCEYGLNFTAVYEDLPIADVNYYCSVGDTNPVYVDEIFYGGIDVKTNMCPYDIKTTESFAWIKPFTSQEVSSVETLLQR